jgi:hypothetical protein
MSAHCRPAQAALRVNTCIAMSSLLDASELGSALCEQHGRRPSRLLGSTVSAHSPTVRLQLCALVEGFFFTRHELLMSVFLRSGAARRAPGSRTCRSRREAAAAGKSVLVGESGLTLQWCSRAAVPNPALRASEATGATASRRLLRAPSACSFSRSNRRAASPAPHVGRAQHTGKTFFGPSDCTYALIGGPLRHSASESQSFATIPGGASRTLARAVACAHASWAPAPGMYASSSRSICGEQRPTLLAESQLCAATLGASLRRAGATGRIIGFSRPGELYKNHEGSPRLSASRITRACSRRGAVCWPAAEPPRPACTSGARGPCWRRDG